MGGHLAYTETREVPNLDSGERDSVGIRRDVGAVLGSSTVPRSPSVLGSRATQRVRTLGRGDEAEPDRNSVVNRSGIRDRRPRGRRRPCRPLAQACSGLVC